MSQSDMVRRWVGALFLAAAAGMLILGQTVLRDRLQGKDFIYYWMGCVAFTGLTLIVALLDMHVVQRRSRREQSKLIEEALQEIIDEESLRERLGKRW